MKARLEDTTAGVGAGAELNGDELHVITQLLDSVAALTGVILLRLRLLTLLLQTQHITSNTVTHMKMSRVFSLTGAFVNQKRSGVDTTSTRPRCLHI